MSNATGLLKRALEELEIHGEVSTWDLIKDIRAFLAAEPEAEYDFYGVIPLTHRKTKGIIEDKGYHVTGFVLTREDADKCIVDMSAVRWLTGKEFFEMMHPPVVSPTAEPEAEPLNAAILPNGSRATNVYEAYEEGLKEGKAETEAEPVACVNTPLSMVYPEYNRLVLGAKPEPARKPMTEEEINRELPFECSGIYFDGFRAGVRFAEKHHGIGGGDA